MTGTPQQFVGQIATQLLADAETASVSPPCVDIAPHDPIIP
jgi:hypothetical protein